MKLKLGATLALGLAALATPGQADAQDVATVASPVPANADVVFSIPVNRPAVGEFESTNLNGRQLTVDLAGGDSFDTDAFAGTHYVRVIDGPAGGLWATIASNDGSSVTLTNDTRGNGVAGLLTGDETVRLYPHHTVDSAFPEEDLGLSYTDGTQILLFDNAATAQNIPFGGQAIVQYNLGGFFPGWSDGDQILPPDTGIGLRNNADHGLTLLFQGDRPDHPVGYLVPDNVNKDVVVSSGYPVNTQVRFSGFGGVDQRQILTFDNNAGVQNLAFGSDTIVQFNVGGFFPGWSDAGLTLPAGDGYALRQNGGPGGVIRTVPVYPIATD